LHPVRPGQTVCYSSQIADAGKSSLKVYIKVYLVGREEILYVEGFVTFLHVDENTRPKAHGIVVTPETEEGIKLQEMARALKN